MRKDVFDVLPGLFPFLCGAGLLLVWGLGGFPWLLPHGRAVEAYAWLGIAIVICGPCLRIGLSSAIRRIRRRGRRERCGDEGMRGRRAKVGNQSRLRMVPSWRARPARARTEPTTKVRA